MLKLNVRNVITPVAADLATHAATENTPRRISPAVLGAAPEPIASAWSPIVVAGVVRIIEFALIRSASALYLGYVVPIEGFEGHYAGAIVGITLLSMIAFQCIDIYQVQAFRGYEK